MARDKTRSNDKHVTRQGMTTIGKTIKTLETGVKEKRTWTSEDFKFRSFLSNREQGSATSSMPVP